MRGADAFLRVTSRLYAAAAEPAEWPAALESATDLLDGGHAIVCSYGSEASILGARVDTREVARHPAAQSGGDLSATGFPMGPRGVVVNRTALISDDEFARSAYYNDWVKQLDGFHSISVMNGTTAGPFMAVVCRSRRRGDFDFAHESLLQLILPHLTAALDLHHRLQMADRCNEALARVFDRLDNGVILLDGAARPVLVNARAAAIAAERDGLVVTDMGVVAGTAVATRALRQVIAAVITAQSIDGGRLRVERPSGRQPLLLTILPIWRLDMVVPGTATPQVAIFLKETDGPAVVDRIALAETFRLTRRESEVAALLGQGCDIPAIATRLGIDPGTVRNHLKRAFEKTSTHSQAALATLASGFSTTCS